MGISFAPTHNGRFTKPNPRDTKTPHSLQESLLAPELETSGSLHRFQTESCGRDVFPIRRQPDSKKSGSFTLYKVPRTN